MFLGEPFRKRGIQDSSEAKPRAVVAHSVGGEDILQGMINRGEALCVPVGTSVYVKIRTLKWSATTAVTQTTEFGAPILRPHLGRLNQ